MKKERNLHEELAARKFKQPNTFLYGFYRNVLHVLYKKFHPHFEIIDDINACEGPAFVVFNHLSRIDHYYVMEACYPRKLNILAGYVEFFRSHLHWVFKKNQILPKKNYASNDMLGMKAMMSIIKQGGTIAFSPEGLASNDGMNKPIVPKTGHMLKHFGIPVYFVELRGEYLQNTKVCLDERYGETYAKLSLLFSPEDLKNLSVDEIDAKMNEAFRGDEYAWQKQKRIKWDARGRICHRLEDMLFRCPRCGEYFTMEGVENRISCRACGNGATMDDYYDFHPFDDSCVIPETPSRWADDERVDVIRKIRADENYAFSEKVKLGRIPQDHYLTDKKTSEVVAEGTLTVNHQGFHFKGDDTAAYDFTMDWKSLYTAFTEVDLSYFSVYVGGEYTDFFPERHSSYLFTLLIEEMHRYHENFYKNHPWNDWMYEGVTKTLAEGN